MKDAPLLKVQCIACKREIFIIDSENMLKVPKDIRPGESFLFLCKCMKSTEAVLLQKRDD